MDGSCRRALPFSVVASQSSCDRLLNSSESQWEGHGNLILARRSVPVAVGRPVTGGQFGSAGCFREALAVINKVEALVFREWFR
jgi:hypothetical protein